MVTPRRISGSEPIEEVKKITAPIGQKNVADEQINPATEDTLAAQLDITLSVFRDAINTELAKKVNKATTQVIYNVAMADADAEYSQALPANTKRFSIHLRDYSEFRFAYETGKVAAPTEPYETIPVGHEKHEEEIEPSSLTLYFASPAATKVAEIEAWS